MDLSKFSNEIYEFDLERRRSTNIFKILRQESYENKHSTFLSWLFDIQASHDFKDEFADRFFKTCFGEDCGIDAKQIKSVRTEVRIAGDEQKKEGKDKRRIDILIIGEKFTCTIENKYGSTAHGGQCPDYRKYIEGRCSKTDKPTSAGKYPLSEGWKNYFVFLDIDKPKDYDDNLTEVYADYDLIQYKQIQEILEKLVEKKHANNEVNDATIFIEQYIKILEEKAKPLSNEIWEKCESLNPNDVQQIIKISDYHNYTAEEVAFIDIVKDYYIRKKEEIDDEIKDNLKPICKDEYYIKSDYGHGKGEVSYAHAIPVSVDFLDVPEYLYKKGEITAAEFAKHKDNKDKEDSDDIKEHKNRIRAEKNEITTDPLFQTVDYRAPRDGNPNINLAIGYGFKPNHSINMASAINKNTIKSMNNLINNDWDVAVQFYITTGSSGAHIFTANFDNKKLKVLTADKFQDLFSKEYFGKKLDYKQIFSNDVFSHINKLRGYLEKTDEYSIENYLFDTLIVANEERIKNSIENIEEILKNDKCNGLYKKWLDSKKPTINPDNKLLNKLLTDCGDEEKYKNKIKIVKCVEDCFRIVNFKYWMVDVLKENQQKFRKLEDIDVDIMTTLKAVIKDRIKDLNKKSEAIKKIDEYINNGKEIEPRQFSDYVMKIIDGRDNVVRTYGISITVTKGIEINDESNRSIELQQGFYKYTLDGLSLFENYQKWFEENVFKPKADLIKMGLKLD